jgi:hypothetical protein
MSFVINFIIFIFLVIVLRYFVKFGNRFKIIVILKMKNNFNTKIEIILEIKYSKILEII